jgi:hypothetical protein
MVWVLMLVGVGIGAGASIAGPWFGGLAVLIFAFLSTFLTRSSRLLAFGAWFLGSFLSSALAFFVIGGLISRGIETGVDLTRAGDAEAQRLAEGAGSLVGGLAGGFFAIIAFFVTLISSLVGLLVGASMRPEEIIEVPTPGVD